jgi:hypothetical protein
MAGELDDAGVIREQPKDLAARIRAGRLPA